MVKIHFLKKILNLTTLFKNKRLLKIFLISYFEYFQIWLNVLMGNLHLSNITNWKEKNAQKKLIVKVWCQIRGQGILHLLPKGGREIIRYD
jgi:hypothetical protein